MKKGRRPFPNNTDTPTARRRFPSVNVKRFAARDFASVKTINVLGDKQRVRRKNETYAVMRNRARRSWHEMRTD